jgi:DNA-binding NarL/FixJ family response regulator
VVRPRGVAVAPLHGYAAARAQEIRDKHPGTAVLVLSQYVESGYALELLSVSAEGVGYLLKDRVSDVGDFTAAVRRVAAGGNGAGSRGRLAPRRPPPRDRSAQRTHAA